MQTLMKLYNLVWVLMAIISVIASYEMIRVSVGLTILFATITLVIAIAQITIICRQNEQQMILKALDRIPKRYR